MHTVHAHKGRERLCDSAYPAAEESSWSCRMKDVNILTASNELTSSLKPGEEGLEYVEAIHKELSMSEPILFGFTTSVSLFQSALGCPCTLLDHAQYFPGYARDLGGKHRKA